MASPAKSYSGPQAEDREQSLRQAVLQLFCDPPRISPRFNSLTGQEWKRLLRWTDISGMTLYFMDRAEEVGLVSAFPPWVYEQMQSRLQNNRERTAALMRDSIDIQAAFRSKSVRYAVAKGISFFPDSVPNVQLRSQMDLDFLVAKESALDARQILEDRGYKLRDISPRTWNFKTDHVPRWGPPADAYKVRHYRCVELHLEDDGPDTRLARRLDRDFDGVTMSVLASSDIFIGQARHSYKNLCSQFSRVSQHLELYRHVLKRRDDIAFWSHVRMLCANDHSVSLRIGASLRLLTELMGDFAPNALAAWTMDRLPPMAQLWFQVYGRSKALCNPPGTKLHLLLQRELEPAGVASARPARTVLFPIYKPHVIVHPMPNEKFAGRMRRYFFQARYISHQLRFHLVEIMRLGWHSMRWRKRISRLEAAALSRRSEKKTMVLGSE
jgi:hypothetical protein